MRSPLSLRAQAIDPWNSMYPELDKLNLPELIACFQNTLPEEESENSIYFDEVALLIRQQSKAGIDFLFGELDRAHLDSVARYYSCAYFSTSCGTSILARYTAFLSPRSKTLDCS